MISTKRRLSVAAAMLLSACAGVAIGQANAPASQMLLTTGQTVLGQDVVYPAGKAQVTGTIITLAPGQETGPHRHDVPLFAYVLEGDLTVDYGPDGTLNYHRGDAFMEAVGTSHNGRATGSEAVRILVVYIGAEGLANSEAQ